MLRTKMMSSSMLGPNHYNNTNNLKFHGSKMPSKKPQLPVVNNEKPVVVGNCCCNISWFLFLTCSVFSLFLVSVNSSLFFRDGRSSITEPVVRNERNGAPVSVTVTPSVVGSSDKPAADASDGCAGKYIYVQELPSYFNSDLLGNCSTLNPWTDACKLLANSGLGLKLNDSDVFSGPNWYATDQFSLEVIFHYRMKQYRCVTNNYSEASAVYVPYYSGLDVGRYLWVPNATLRDSDSIKLVEYLRQKPEWNKFGGRDHFLIASRISYAFRRESDNTSTPNGYGNRLLLLPEVKNMTTLLIEASPASNSEIGIPYPTSFHPTSENEVVNWQESVKQKERPYLFSFAGAPRPNLPGTLRNIIIEQCLASKNCKHLHTNPGVKAETVMKLFQSSEFCVQPPGDSFTRKSVFDTILAGCIPVLLHPNSAYVQYLWHLPKNYTSYSVLLPIDELKQGNVSIEERLLEIPKKDIIAMRKEVIKLIPKIVYANVESEVEVGLEDAFDVAVKGVIDRVDRFKLEIEGAENATSESIPDGLAWKYNFFGDLENHDWDKYFGY